MIADLRWIRSTEARETFRFTLIQQLLCVSFCALLLDGGLLAKICVASMIGYWIGVVWLLIRRPQCKSWTDLVFLRWGFFLLFVASLTLTGLVAYSRG